MTTNQKNLNSSVGKLTSTYEPPSLEIRLTLALGMSVLSPYYRSFVRDLGLRGDEQVLDFGSGSGICSRHLAARLQRGAGRLACVDVSYGWMKVVRRTLRRYNNVSYHCGQINEISLPVNAFDAVVMHFVLHEIPAAERPLVMKTLAQKLKMGGRLLLREPQNEGLEIDELNNLAALAGLQPISVIEKKVAMMQVIDGCFIRKIE